MGYSLDFSITFCVCLWNPLPDEARNPQQNALEFPALPKPKANDILFFLSYPASAILLQQQKMD